MLLGGCIAGRADAPGDVTLALGFDGATCPANVARLEISVPDELLPNDGVYPCAPTIVLRDQAAGFYDISVYAFDAAGTALYTGTAQYSPSGDATVPVQLQSLGVPASIEWTFPGGQTCAQ